MVGFVVSGEVYTPDTIYMWSYVNKRLYQIV